MITDFLSSAVFRLKAPFRARPKIDIDDVSSFLKHSRGVIHVGANKGQERYLYDSLGLDVLWIEPIPAICKRLRRNVAGFRKQRVLEALLLDQPGTQVVLHVANNGGASSSIFDFKLHTDIWPDVRYTHDLPLTSKTLPGLLHESGIEVGRYDALLIDTQGSELLILQGARDILSAFRFIQVEAADFAAYDGAATTGQITTFLNEAGFRFLSSRRLAVHDGGGTYCDMVFEAAA